MQSSPITETKPNGLATLSELLSLANPEAITVAQLCNGGLSETEATLALELSSHVTALRQKLALYEDKDNELLLQKQQEMRLKLLDQQMNSSEQTMNLITKLKTSLIDNASGTLGAFNRVLFIYTVAFVVGVLLIITGVVFAAMGKTILAIAFGTIGLVDMLTYFFKMPASQIQESRSNLSQLQVVLLVWLKDFVNNDAITAANPTIEGYKTLSAINVENTAILLKLIQDLAEPKG